MKKNGRIARTLLLTVLILAMTVPGAMAMTFKVSTTGSARVYAKPSSSAQSVKIGGGVDMTVTAISDGWARVKKNGVTAYVKADKLKPQESGRVKNAVAFALLQIDKPYGTGAPYNFNCSSLVNYCYGKYGIRVGGTAAEICADNGLKGIAPNASLQFGDILCFDGNEDGTCDHVAIYLTGGKMVHASQSSGRVIISSLSSWYKSHMLCARRI